MCATCRRDSEDPNSLGRSHAAVSAKAKAIESSRPNNKRVPRTVLVFPLICNLQSAVYAHCTCIHLPHWSPSHSIAPIVATEQIKQTFFSLGSSSTMIPFSVSASSKYTDGCHSAQHTCAQRLSVVCLNAPFVPCQHAYFEIDQPPASFFFGLEHLAENQSSTQLRINQEMESHPTEHTGLVVPLRVASLAGPLAPGRHHHRDTVTALVHHHGAINACEHWSC